MKPLVARANPPIAPISEKEIDFYKIRVNMLALTLIKSIIDSTSQNRPHPISPTLSLPKSAKLAHKTYFYGYRRQNNIKHRLAKLSLIGRCFC